jgi:superfamily II DNA or RNA helicase
VAARLKTLEAESAASAALRLAPPPADQTPRSAAEKVALFRSLFRGRSDVYPTRFVNLRTRKAGYAPACTNKFVPGVCGLPKVKCGSCHHQAFPAVSDQAFLDHLRGRHIMGVYPLLTDDSCWLLAMDFDKASWQEDVAAVRDTCRQAGVPVAVERSQSGNGAHLWIFFSAPVAASQARAMGCALITETMTRHHQLAMASYDRLFPNQDTLPRGGFGNLIALPLQRAARERGNTIFLDDNLVPWPDQWRFLGSLRRLDPATVLSIAADAERRNAVLGVPARDLDDPDDATPWMQLPSRPVRPVVVTEPLPESVTAVLAQRLYLQSRGLPSSLLNQLKRLAAFQNPAFHARQRLRLSTALTPRIIACAEELPQLLSLPRGCLDDARAFLTSHGVRLNLEDRREEGEAIPHRFQGELTPLQQRAAAAVLAYESGVLLAPPGSGKTVIATSIIAERGRSTLVLVHRRQLFEQWVTQLALFLGVPESSIGRYGGGLRRVTGQVDVAMLPSLVNHGAVNDLVARYGQVIVDECHHVPAVTFERILSEVRARYLVGLTATRQRRDGLHPILDMQLGPVRFVMNPRDLALARPFTHRLVVRETAFDVNDEGPTIQALYRRMAIDPDRNRMIIQDILAAVAEGRLPVVLTERRQHVESLAEALRSHVAHVVVFQGGASAKARRSTTQALRTTPSNEPRVVLATGRYLGEGFDDARLDTLFLAMPISWKGTLVQYAGRLQRLHPGKHEVRVVDYVDRQVPMLAAMFEKRLRTYRSLEYAPHARSSEPGVIIGPDDAQGDLLDAGC